MSIKTLILSCLGLAAAATIGGLASYYILCYKYEIRLHSLVRVYDQSRVLGYGSNAFKAYLQEAPAVGIYAMEYHLRELDERAAMPRSTLVLIDHKDLKWMRTVAHVRLANLYAKAGHAQISSNHMDTAEKLLLELRVREITNRGALIRHVQEADAKKNWL